MVKTRPKKQMKTLELVPGAIERSKKKEKRAPYKKQHEIPEIAPEDLNTRQKQIERARLMELVIAQVDFEPEIDLLNYNQKEPIQIKTRIRKKAPPLRSNRKWTKFEKQRALFLRYKEMKSPWIVVRGAHRINKLTKVPVDTLSTWFKRFKACQYDFEEFITDQRHFHSGPRIAGLTNEIERLICSREYLEDTKFLSCQARCEKIKFEFGIQMSSRTL